MMSQQELKLFLEEKLKSIRSRNVKIILKKVYGEIRSLDLKILFDFLGEVLLEKPDLQEGKNHSKFLKGYDEFITEMLVKKEFNVFQLHVWNNIL